MLVDFLKKIFGSSNERLVQRYQKMVDKINELEPEIAKLSDAELRNQTNRFKSRLEKGETLDDLLIEAFATVREASKRCLGMRHFDVQLIGGIVLHKGFVAEMRTGEGKTLVATLPIYLNALSGKGVHAVTVNDYLVRRDSEWMGQIYRFLGLKVGCILNELNDDERRQAYACDITHGTNNEFGFDYLRDNMKFDLKDMVQRPFNFAIIDEVDSILIDEARTPLIISGPAEDSSELYVIVDKLIRLLGQGDYEKDEKHRSVTLTEAGNEKIEHLLRQSGALKEGNLYDVHNVALVQHVNQSLRAHTLFRRDTDYIIKDNRVIIIDEFTGRMMEGRRYSDGLHQALEAKEGVKIQTENQTLASITFQNYFRLYPKLAGMTGTAMTEAAELGEIYKLEVVELPTHKPIARIDHNDEVYRTAREKYEAIIKLIEECRQRQQSVLVGTVSIEKSEYLSSLLKKRHIPHQVLNARYHDQEAFIIAQAGAPGAVTIATNMAGRGTDIKLGGNLEMYLQSEIEKNPKLLEDKALFEKRRKEIEAQTLHNQKTVIEAGGLYVIGTERHESRRIDNQLRGRSGRQGDPGASKFFLSLEDDLMRIFGSDRLDSMLQKLGLEEGEAITHPWVNKALERAQRKVEARDYDIRKQLLRFDDVMNDQRKAIYSERREIMEIDNVTHHVFDFRDSVIEAIVQRTIPANSHHEQWDAQALYEQCMRLLALNLPVKEWFREEGVDENEIIKRIRRLSDELIQSKIESFGEKEFHFAEKNLVLHILDHVWKLHLLSLDQLRQGISLRSYAQRDPLNEYKREAFIMFENMFIQFREMVTMAISHLNIDVTNPESLTPNRKRESYTTSNRGNTSASKAPNPSPAIDQRIRRNAPCPCGSGKKFKICHGKIA